MIPSPNVETNTEGYSVKVVNTNTQKRKPIPMARIKIPQFVKTNEFVEIPSVLLNRYFRF